MIAVSRQQVTEAALAIGALGALVVGWGALAVIRGTAERRQERLVTLIDAAHRRRVRDPDRRVPRGAVRERDGGRLLALGVVLALMGAQIATRRRGAAIRSRASRSSPDW